MKLNFGCGQRYRKGWVNIDFHSDSPEVQRVNLLGKLPFADNSFDVVYSSHTLEHFSLRVTERILAECRRVLKPEGIIRTVLPDLENTCREYVRVMDGVYQGDAKARRQYDWIILELLDQLTRTKASGLMYDFSIGLERRQDREMIDYVQSRTNSWSSPGQVARPNRSELTPAKIKNKLIYLYVEAVKKLFPASLRDAIVDETRIGEKHKWMYDRHSLGMLMERCGFRQVVFHTAWTSDVPGFAADLLDVEPDGSAYKPCSLFCEARK